MTLKKLDCFTDVEWAEYVKYVVPSKAGKNFNPCFDCTKEFQHKMRCAGKCERPLLRLAKVSEYS